MTTQAGTVSKETIKQIYDELETLSVPLEKNPQRGLSYLKEKMLECRGKQDRVTDLLARVAQLHPAIRTRVRNLKAAVNAAEGSPEVAELHAELNDAKDQDDEIRMLMEVVKAKKSNLTMTSSDIRLLYSIVEQQLKLGEVTPTRHSNAGDLTLPTSFTHPEQQPQTPPQKIVPSGAVVTDVFVTEVTSDTDSPVSIESFLGKKAEE